MQSRTEQLADRRRVLQLRCELQRQQMTLLSMEIENKLLTADRLFAIAAVAKNPAILTGAAAGIFFLGPWRIFRWIGQGVLVFNIVRRLRDWFGKQQT